MASKLTGCVHVNLNVCDFSEIHAAQSVSYLNNALGELKDIWEEIGIPEDQRLQRTDAVHMHIKVRSGHVRFSSTGEWRHRFNVKSSL